MKAGNSSASLQRAHRIFIHEAMEKPGVPYQCFRQPKKFKCFCYWKTKAIDQKRITSMADQRQGALGIALLQLRVPRRHAA